jgi:predicted glycosyltransferase
MRIWVDFTNTAHVIVLRPLVERLEAAGHELELTARPLSHTVELLEDWGRPHTVVGRYGGVARRDKARAAADRVARLLAWARRRRFDAALAHGSTDVPVVSRALRIPNTTMFDYEWAALQHHVNCRLATRVLVPEAIPPERLARYGARPRKLVRYPGLK